MATMTAFRLTAYGEPPSFQEVPVPRPGAGELLIEVKGAGLCHSDLLFMGAPEGRYPFPAPFTLGHEVAGVVAAVGPQAESSGFEIGDAVVVGSRRPCGRCTYCQRGADNYCENALLGLGYGQDGGLSRFVVASPRQLVALGEVDPVVAAPLPDAGRTAYHAVRKVAAKLTPGSTAIVIGAGGLGTYALQLVRLMTPARLVVVDIAPERLSLAKTLGAHEVVKSDANLDGVLRDATEGRGAEVVLDFVGSDATAATALGICRPMGSVIMAGAAGGTARVSWTSVAREVDVCIPQGGSMADLRDVVALVQSDQLASPTSRFGFDQVVEAYRRVESGEVTGRAVVVDPGVSASDPG